MGLFGDNDDLNDMFSDWEKRMREHRKKMKDEGEDGKSFMGNMHIPLGDDFEKLNELGEPDDIVEFEEGGVNFVRKTWTTEGGEYVLIETILDDEGNIFTNPISLDEQLEEALEEEEYEKAAELRDKIADKKINDELFTDKHNVNIKK